MSFLEILREARQNKTQTVDETPQIVEEQEVVKSIEEKKVVKNEVLQYIYLGDWIVEISKQATLNTRKLNAINSARRLAKKLCTGNITSKDLEKCFKMQQRFPNSKNLNYQLVGGDALNKLSELLKSGVKLNDALNYKIER